MHDVHVSNSHHVWLRIHIYSTEYILNMCVAFREDALIFVRSIDINKLGNSQWTPHLDKFHKVLLLGVIDHMARHCVPLEEDSVMQIAKSYRRLV